MKRDQLKKALLEAGLVSKDKQKEIRRESSTKRHIKKQRRSGHEHQLRILCELCKKTTPDVEYYEHRNKLVGNNKWLCLRCADDNQIDDQCRQTAQSTQSKTKLFSRQYGRTKKL
jgi:hypothetical protein